MIGNSEHHEIYPMFSLYFSIILVINFVCLLQYVTDHVNKEYLRRIYTSIERCEELNALSPGLGKNLMRYSFSTVYLQAFNLLYLGKLFVEESKATHIMEVESDVVRKRMANHTFEVTDCNPVICYIVKLMLPVLNPVVFPFLFC